MTLDAHISNDTLRSSRYANSFKFVDYDMLQVWLQHATLIHMVALLAYYKQQLKTTLAIQFQYRVGMAIWTIDVILQPTVYMVVWRSAAGGGAIAGFDAGDFAAYYIVLLIVGHLTETWHMWEYEYYIREGVLSSRLLRPVHPVHRDISANITYKLLMAPVIVVSALGLTVLFGPTFNAPLWALFVAPAAILLAAALTFVFGWVVAMAAFWTTRIVAINQTYFLMMLFFSGQLAPLDVLPGPLRTITDILPFRWMIFFPVELTLGRLSVGDAGLGLVAQILWLVCGVVVALGVWSMGIRRYGAVGG